MHLTNSPTVWHDLNAAVRHTSSNIASHRDGRWRQCENPSEKKQSNTSVGGPTSDHRFTGLPPGELFRRVPADSRARSLSTVPPPTSPSPGVRERNLVICGLKVAVHSLSYTAAEGKEEAGKEWVGDL
ncbi:hypothetical protein PoB_003095100 [Plakobranchus ocellatus]|uniref:Uncharacterized protein n=1 Tax=Plakobranchus ocellatus TaxID=259542 RepID=A0AAV4A845_9GAST|nr:hypothetical protein PoB_003095100 [Plakobranchus ocellatus]